MNPNGITYKIRKKLMFIESCGFFYLHNAPHLHH